MDLKIQNAVEDILKKNSDILFAYIFGSKLKKGRFGSDLDIAVYFKDEPGILEIGALVLKLEEAVNCKVDLVSLNNLDKINPTLAFSIISNGIVAYLKNEELFKLFKKSVILQYLDFKPVGDLFNKNFNKRLANYKFAVSEK